MPAHTDGGNHLGDGDGVANVLLSWWDPPPPDDAASPPTTATTATVMEAAGGGGDEKEAGAGGRPRRCPDRLHVAFTAARPVAAGEVLTIHAHHLHNGHVLVENATFAGRCTW